MTKFKLLRLIIMGLMLLAWSDSMAITTPIVNPKSEEAGIQQALIAANIALNECREKRIRGELKSHVESVNCSNPRIIDEFKKIGFPDMDLILQYTSKRLATAEKEDKNELTSEQGNQENKKDWLEVVTQARQRDGLNLTPAESEGVSHILSYGDNRKTKEIELLQVKLGNWEEDGNGRDHDPILGKGHMPQSQFVILHSLPEDFLDVKWRALSTGKVYEDLVDLRGRLPSDMAFKIIKFAVIENQLRVYLISMNAHPNPKNDKNMIISHVDYEHAFMIYPERKQVSIKRE